MFLRKNQFVSFSNYIRFLTFIFLGNKFNVCQSIGAKIFEDIETSGIIFEYCKNNSLFCFCLKQ